MSHRPSACHCDDACPVCRRGATDPQSIAKHNLKVACHGERTYPGEPYRLPPKDWLRELYEG